MKIMLARPVATENIQTPLQNKLRPTETIHSTVLRFQPINVAKCLESTRDSKVSFYPQEFSS